MTKQKVGVVGLGNMGGGIARNFLEEAIAYGMADADYSRLYERFNEIVAAVGNSKKLSDGKRRRSEKS